MANNFVMRRAGSTDPWTSQIPSDGSTSSGSASFEVKPVANNESSFDLTGRLEVNLVNSSKRLVCNLRQKGHIPENEDPGKLYKFYFRGKADIDRDIFVGIECDGRLLENINTTNQDIADYQQKTGTGLISREATFYVDIFSYYIQGTKDSSGRYVFDDRPENRVQVNINVSNLPEWLSIGSIIQVEGITDGGIANCTCWRVTFRCEPLTNYNTDGEPDQSSSSWTTRFPLDTPDGHYRGIPRTKTIRIQPEVALNQKEINFKQYGGYRSNIIFGKQLELSDQELAQAASGYYEIIADNTGSMYRYNQSTLNQLPKVDFGKYDWPALNPTVDFIFKLGARPTNEYFEQSGFKEFVYIGYPHIVCGLHIVNTLDYGDSQYDTLHMGGFNSTDASGYKYSWVYIQGSSMKQKLALNTGVDETILYFGVQVVSLNDLHSKGYIDVPSKLSGNSQALRTPIPYINIPNIVMGKRSLTASEGSGFLQWRDGLNNAWAQKLHTTSQDTVLKDLSVGDSASTYLIIPYLMVTTVDYGGIGSNGDVILNEWIPVEKASGFYDSGNLPPAISLLTWGPDFPDDPTNVYSLTYDEAIQFRFKVIN